MPISRETLNEIIDLLSPFLTSSATRATLLDRALGLDERSTALRSQIDFDGPTSNFVVALVRQLHDYGDIEPGKTALWLVMESARETMGLDRQARVDALRPLLNQMAHALPISMTYAPPSSDHVFISYSRADKELVLRLVADLEPRGVRVWVDQSGLTPGTPDWEQALRDAIRGSRAVILAASPDSRRSVYVKDELRIAQMYERPIYPIWVSGEQWMDSIPMGLGGVQFIDLRGETYAAGSQTLAHALRPVDTPIEVPKVAEPAVVERDPQARNPYKGLQAFTAADTRYFFGRETLATELMSALNDQERFLAVVGASGSGKSSVVMAGLLPRLAQNHRDWTFLGRMVPGTHPLETLAQTLAKEIPGSLALTIQRELESDNALRGLHLLAGQINPTQVVLFVDQFEELFTLTTDEAERSRFITLLTTAAAEARGALRVVLTMRADFMDRPLAYEELARLFQAHTVLVKPMAVTDLRDLIVRPAALQGLTFEEDLVGDLLFEVRGEAGALPLLEFTLEQLYERRDGQMLRRTAYRAIGGVRGALAGQAERTYLELPSEGHRQLARALFLRLIEPGVTEQDTTRRRATRADLTLLNEDQTHMLLEVAARFVNGRLLVSGESTLEVAHEALIREWTRLKNWLNEARDELRIQNKINDDAADWVRAGRPSDYGGFYAGSLLENAKQWQASSVVAVDEADFIAASEAAEINRRNRDAATARRVQNSQRASVVLALLAVGAVGAGIFSLLTANTAQMERGIAQTAQAVAVLAQKDSIEKADEAATQVSSVNTQVKMAETGIANVNATLSPVPGTLTKVANDILAGQVQLDNVDSQRIAALGEILLARPAGNDETAALLGIRAANSADTSAAWDLLHASVDGPNYGLAMLSGHTDDVSGALQLSDGRLLSWSADRMLRLWNQDGIPGRLLEGHTDTVSGALELSNGRILSWSADGTLRLWNVNGTPGPILEGHTDTVLGALELSNGRILSWSADRTLRLWNADGTSGPVLGVYTDPMLGTLRITNGRLFVQDGHTDTILGARELSYGRILSWSADRTLRLWNADGTPGPILGDHKAAVTGALELRDGQLLSWSGDNTLRLWAANGTPGPILEGHTDFVNGAIQLRDGRLLSWSADHTLHLWNADGRPGPILGDHTAAVTGALELRDGRLLSWSADFTLRLWNTDGTSGPVLEGHTDTISGALELEDGRILSWSTDHTLRLWNPDGTPGSRLEGHTEAVVGVLRLADGRILSWSQDDTLRLWNAVGTLGSTMTGHTDAVVGAIQLSDTRLLSWAKDGTLRLWNPNGIPDLTLDTHTKAALGMSVIETSDGHILSWARDRTLRLWNPDGMPGPVLAGHTDAVVGAAQLSEGHILSWSEDGTLRLWNMDGAPVSILAGHTDTVYGALELADGRILSWSTDHTLRLWNPDGTPGPVLAGHMDIVYGARELADGHILSWSTDHTLRLWNPDGTPGLVLAGHTDTVVGAIQLTDGRILSWARDLTLRLWNPDGTPAPALQGYADPVVGAIQLADGRILSWSSDGRLRLWNTNGTPGRLLEGHRGAVVSAVQLADGRILSWSTDHTLRLWNTDGTPDLVLEGHRDAVVGATQLTDGRILSWSADRTLRLWYTRPADFAAFACTRMIRDFTPEERVEFGLDNDPTCPKFARGH